MTNKEAIAELKAMPIIYPITNGENDRASRLMQARDMAIKALKQEPCEDAIRRQAVLDITWEEPSYADPLNVLTEVRDKVNDLPPVTPQPKTGHWMIDEDSTDRFFATYACSCCKRAIIVPHDLIKAVYKDYPFCHCGAKMVELQESEG